MHGFTSPIGLTGRIGLTVRRYLELLETMTGPDGLRYISNFGFVRKLATRDFQRARFRQELIGIVCLRENVFLRPRYPQDQHRILHSQDHHPIVIVLY